MKTFEINKTYSVRSICDHNCIWTFEVLKRTKSTITLMEVDTKEVKTCRINAETVFPLGKYSMCPVLSADKEN